MYTIRRLRQSDHEKVYRLFSNCIESQFPEYSPAIRSKIVYDRRYWNKNNYKTKLRSKYRVMFGVFKNTVLVGILDAETPFAGVSMGSWLMVDPNFQRKGIGKMLINRWQKEIKKRGGHLLYLYSPRRNIGYYRKIGFNKAGVIRNGYFGLDDYIFSKQIAQPKESRFLQN